MTVSDHFKTEVATGERFQFGKNWARFLRSLDDDRIALAEKSLRDMLGVDTLDGKTFLDVGSGSGLFSLVARRLGATVRSFDYDPQSYACTMELRRRYFPDDAAWVVERGSVLDRAFLGTLGTYDIVYSWGVLHHTGQMWTALDNVKPLVEPGGQLYIAIYNDLGAITDRWEMIKRRYNKLPVPLNTAYVLWLLGRQQRVAALGAIRNKAFREWLRSWTDYKTVSLRGMSRWRDEIDWYGGLPYERASIEAVADVYARDGFRLDRISDNSTGYGCNEFVFMRVAGAGTFIDFPIPGGLSFARRHGRRVLGPFEKRAGFWWGRLASVPVAPKDAKLYLLRNDSLVATVDIGADRSIAVARADEAAAAVASAKFHVVAAVERAPAEDGFHPEAGLAWQWFLPDLATLADDSRPDRKGSPVFVFEGGKQLPWPYATHEDIRNAGLGRFSHWGNTMLFSTLENVDPNTVKDRIMILIAASDPLQRP